MIEYNLEELTDEQVTTYIKSYNHKTFIDIFDKNKQYTVLAMKFHAKKVDIKKELPPSVLALYKKKDSIIYDLIQENLNMDRDAFIRFLSGYFGYEVKSEDLEQMTVERVLEILEKYMEDGEDNGRKHNPELFELLMETCGAPLDINAKLAIKLKYSKEEAIEEVKKEKGKKKAKKEENTDTNVAAAEAAEAQETAAESESEEMTAEAAEAAKKAAEEAAAAEEARKAEEEMAAKAARIAEEAAKRAAEEAAAEAARKAAEEAAAEAARKAAEEAAAEAARKAAEEAAAEEARKKEEEGEEIGGIRYYPYSGASASASIGAASLPEQIYAGRIDIRQTFYNFALIGEIQGTEYFGYRESDLDRVLPESAFHNIQLFQAYRADETQIKYMDSHFKNGQVVLFDFTLNDLEVNLDSFGNRNRTGWRVDGYEMARHSRIKFLWEAGLYAVKPSDVLLDDIETKKVVKINYVNIVAGEKILINLKNGFYAGPYEVKYYQPGDYYYIQPQVVENKYVITGYKSTDCARMNIEEGYDVVARFDSVPVYYIKKDAKPVCRDVISDNALLQSMIEAFKTMPKDLTPEERIARIVQGYDESELSSHRVPEVIRRARIRRLNEMISSEDKLNELLDGMADVITGMLLKNIGDSRIDELIEHLAEKNPSILDNAQSVRSINERLETAREELELVKQEKERVNDEIQRIRKSAEEAKLDEEFEKKSKELSSLLKELDVVQEASQLNARVEGLKRDLDYYEVRAQHLKTDIKPLEKAFVEMVNDYSSKLVNLSFDGFMSSKLLQAATQWEQKEEAQAFAKSVEEVAKIQVKDWSKEELIAYLVEKVQIMRPEYDKNTIVNLFICSMQSVLTVFSGAPGCGKTSICNIMGKVLGLTEIGKKLGYESALDGDENGYPNRYIPVSVEKGWTSKRDLIGYYNPLTKAFEENNRDVFDGLRTMNIEANKGNSPFPYIILLDEANLSPMEYYWADFMNACDDISKRHTINLGNEYIFSLPETLHFVATINNDHTTEILSPRVVDRAWVVTLPKNKMITHGGDIPAEEIEIVSWKAMKETFWVPNTENPVLTAEIQKIYDKVKEYLSQEEFSISHRADLAVKRYIYVARTLMEGDEFGNTPNIIALDYAISQKILPKIEGTGEAFGEWLKGLKDLCSENSLLKSEAILEEMIKRGDHRMKFYRFFG